MKSKFTMFIMAAIVITFSACKKDGFNEKDAVQAETTLLDLQYQHEVDLETLKDQAATAMQQLINQGALNQLKLNDSLQQASAVAALKKDYSIAVVDVVSNAPVAGATVTVSSQGKVFDAVTNAQGVASFTALYLFSTSSFLITKTGYAATQILQKDINLGPAKLWDTADLTNQITGTLYIETDLTNTKPETVGANVLVTASAVIPTNSTASYTVSFPTYSTATGTYTLNIPATPNGYTLSFGQVTASQKLYVNATESDAGTTFPASLPRLTTVTTYFNVNSYNAPVPTVTNAFYLKVDADNGGKTLYIPGGSIYYYYYGYNQVYVSAVNGKFQVERLNINDYASNGNVTDFNAYTYAPNSKINVQLVDVAGNIVQTAPMLAATTDANGKLTYYSSPEGGIGYVHLKRDNSGALVPNAKGVILRAGTFDPGSNSYLLNFSANLNTTSNIYTATSFTSLNKGDTKVVNFYYGSGDSRVLQVY
jgi:hypothetical protein